MKRAIMGSHEAFSSAAAGVEAEGPEGAGALEAPVGAPGCFWFNAGSLGG
jgi:hypothetical protein